MKQGLAVKKIHDWRFIHKMKGVIMELVPKLVAAADMCEEGEDVNLDEMAFLLRYSVDELQKQEVQNSEHDLLLSRERDRVLARLDLLNGPTSDKETVANGSLSDLFALSDRLDADVRRLYMNNESESKSEEIEHAFPIERFGSGR